jgi:hypothetical protein
MRVTILILSMSTPFYNSIHIACLEALSQIRFRNLDGIYIIHIPNPGPYSEIIPIALSYVPTN